MAQGIVEFTATQMSLSTSIDELAESLEIDENGLDEALLQQPDLYWRVSKALANAIAERDWSKDQLAMTAASVDLRVRKRLAKRDEKVTEGEVKAWVATDPELEQAQKAVRSTSKSVAEWQALERSFDQRMSALKKLVDLYVNNYYVSSGLTAPTSSMKDHNANVARRAMTEARRQRTVR